MAHGLAGTKDSGLRPFARALAGAGIDVVAFDYRGFGASGGRPRQRVSVVAQVEDYRAAMRAAGGIEGVDAGRLVLWGVSLSGGHVLRAAADRDDVAAVIALTPLVDGLAAGRLAARHHRPLQLARSAATGVGSLVSTAAGGRARMIPVVAPPGEVGALTVDGARESYLRIAGPTWRNEVDAGMALELVRARQVRYAPRLRAPALVQIADFDRSAPPHAAAKAAFAARAEVRHYPCDHFDVHVGAPWHEQAVAHQLAFLQRTLHPTADVRA